MHRIRLRLVLAATFTAAMAAALTLTAGAGPAAAGTPAEHLTAAVSSGPFTITIQAQRAANSPADSATGEFSAHGAFGSVGLLSLHGPVTCLDVRGNRAGLFYPITASDPPVFAKLHSGVFVYLDVSSTGKPLLLGFVPAPVSHATSCAPGLALLPITSGSATLVP